MTDFSDNFLIMSKLCLHKLTVFLLFFIYLYSGSCTNGSGRVGIGISSKNNLLMTFPANNTTDTITGIFNKGERYIISATVSKAKGRFEFKME